MHSSCCHYNIAYNELCAVLDVIDHRAEFSQILDSIKFIFTPYKMKNNHWVFLALDVCNQMLLFPDLRITIFIASAHVVQAGEEIVNRIAMKKFGFSLEKFGILKDYWKLIALCCLYAHLLAKLDELNILLQ